MKIEIRIGGVSRSVELARNGSGWSISLDGTALDADVAEVAPNTFSVLLNGESHEVRVAPMPGGGVKLHTGTAEYEAEVVDSRAWRGRRHGALEAEGRQHVAAPMPGKVVRILVSAGGAVKAGQGIIVVEAMKMQNEIRSPKSGRVERLLVREGQAVNAGETLAWID